MDYTLEGIRQRVLVDKLDDDEFDAGIVDRFINDTQRNIFNQYELTFQEKIFQGTVPSQTTMFKFPDDVAKLQALTITGPDGSQSDLMPMRMQFRDFVRQYPTPGNNQSGAVARWALYGGNMLLNAPLDQDYTMTIFYIKKPKTLVSPTDVPEIPEEFSELLLNGAFMRVQKRNEDYDLAAVTENEYNNDLNLLVARYGDRIADGPIIMGNQQIRN
jgi:hypothetical protein